MPQGGFIREEWMMMTGRSKVLPFAGTRAQIAFEEPFAHETWIYTCGRRLGYL